LAHGKGAPQKSISSPIIVNGAGAQDIRPHLRYSFIDMDDFEIFELSERMRQTPAFARLQELDRLSNTLQIFESNYRELDHLLWFICESSVGDGLFRRENRSAWEQAMAECIRLLQNFVASVKALVDHSRRLYERLYEPFEQFPEYPEEVKRRFAENELVQFVQGLRNYCLHYRIPALGTTMKLVDIQSERFVKQVTLAKADLLNFAWNGPAKRFLERAANSIDLKEAFSQYHAQIEQFYDWFSQKIRILHASDYDTISRHYAALLSSKPERHSAELESRLKAFESGIGSAFDVLNPFMTSADASEIAALLGNTDEWVNAALEKVSKYFTVRADVSSRLHATLARHWERP
jgi:hypothetical protein